MVYGFCLRLVRIPVIAEEITSDVFVKLWEKRLHLNRNISVKGILFKITHDLCINSLKKIARVKELKKEFLRHYLPEYQNVEKELAFFEYLNIAQEAIEKLPPRRKEVFKLHYINSMNPEQIALKTGISKSTVNVHIHKASKFIKSYLHSHPEVMINSFLLAVLYNIV